MTQTVGSDGSGPSRGGHLRAVEDSDDGGLDLIALGRRVRHLRKKHGMTLDDLAAELGTSPSQLSLL